MSKSFEKDVKTFLGPKGPLTRLLPHYEYRPEQEAMAAAVLSALSRAEILMVEAGTGTGKTLAYLAPALYSKQRVLISTGTKALQEQLMNKDLPILAKHFDLKAALMKGRQNYLCWQRWREFSRAPSFRFRDDISHYERIEKWTTQTRAGDRAEIKGLPDDFSTWREISATSEQCAGQKCSYFEQCFVTAMRAKAQEADIVVVNHHLFFADLAVRSEAKSQVIPSYTTVIFDEAHALAEVATEYFGTQASNWRMEDLSRDIRRLQKVGRLAVDDLRAMVGALEKAEIATTFLFQLIAQKKGGDGENSEGSRFALDRIVGDRQVIEDGERATVTLQALAQHLAGMGKGDENILGLAERAKSMAGDLAFILQASDPDHVFWAEARGRGVILKASPVELGTLLGPLLFTEPRPMIFTSATLAVQQDRAWSFSHFKQALGLEPPPRASQELHLPSSYNWKDHAILYVPDQMPDPSHPAFIQEAALEIEQLLKISKGRAFLLFTSYRNLTAAYDLLAERLDFPVLKQGDAPRSELLDRFRDDESSVLFATQSFWQGVDVAGQSLSAVIIDKLPFDSPGDPLIAARINRLKRAGKNAFLDYQLPAAVLALKQGLGRLIRTKNDYGLLAVLDRRLLTKHYGQTFLASLPPAPMTTEREELKRFFEKHEKNKSGPRWPSPQILHK